MSDLQPEYEPFDLALAEYFGIKCYWPKYRALVEIGVKAGDPQAIYTKATWYQHGHRELRVARSPKRAFALLKAAAPNYNRAMYGLAMSYLLGSGVARNERLGNAWMQRAAKTGMLAARLWLGDKQAGAVLARFDTIAPPTEEESKYAPYEPFDIAMREPFRRDADWKKYRALVELGVKAGDPLALHAKATWYAHGHRELKIAPSPRRAFALLTAAAPNYNRAMYALALAYRNGKGVAWSWRQWMVWLRRAANHGVLDARLRLAVELEESTKSSERKRGMRMWNAAEKLLESACIY